MHQNSNQCEGSHLEGNIVCENYFLAFLYWLRVILLCYEFHAGRIACHQIWSIVIEWSIIPVFYAKRLDLKPNNA
jgi:hypothetical protein